MTAKTKLCVIDAMCETGTCREHCRSLMALRLPFQCSSWNTVISSCKQPGVRGKNLLTRHVMHCTLNSDSCFQQDSHLPASNLLLLLN